MFVVGKPATSGYVSYPIMYEDTDTANIYGPIAALPSLKAAQAAVDALNTSLTEALTNTSASNHG